MSRTHPSDATRAYIQSRDREGAGQVARVCVPSHDGIATRLPAGDQGADIYPGGDHIPSRDLRIISGHLNPPGGANAQMIG